MAASHKEDLLKTLEDNAKQVSAGKVLNQFKDLPTMLGDPTNPLTAEAHSLATAVTGKVPLPTGPSHIKPAQSKTDIKNLVIKCSAKLGVAVDPTHIEDLYATSSAEKTQMSERDITMYLRGVIRANQLSMTTALSKVISNVESILTKSQQVMQANIDSNKLIAEKVTLVGTKLDGVVPAVSSIVMSEHAATRHQMTILGQVTKTVTRTEKVSEAAGPSRTPTSPEKSDILQMCAMVGCPPAAAETIAEKYVGIVAWNEYQLVMSGAVDKIKFKEMANGWKKKVEG